MLDFKVSRIALLVFSVLLLSACGSGSDTDVIPAPVLGLQPTPVDKLIPRQKSSCDQVRDYVSTSLADNYLLDGVSRYCIACLASTDGSQALDSATSSDSVSSAGFFESVTGTNNQEAGVDELDAVATSEAGVFYTLDGRHLVIAQGLPPAELREIASLNFGEDVYPEGLLFDADNQRLVVAATGFSPFEPISFDNLIAPASYPTTELFFVDVQDPSNPVIDGRLMLDGFRLAVRKIDDRVHLVSHFTPAIPPEILASDQLWAWIEEYRALAEDDSARDSLEGDIRGLIDDIFADTDGRSFVPSVRLQQGAGELVDVTNADCSDVAIPDVSLSYALTTVLSINTDSSSLGTLSLVNNSWNVYASTNTLYLMQPSGGWWFDPLQKQETAIFGVDIGDTDPAFRALGVVDGWADNSFQLSEYDGHLRVVTNRSEFDPREDAWFTDNNLYVLRDNGAGRLSTVGEVLAFGPEETIFSARFLGDRGYVVTFRQIDPLFTFDLSDPADPKLMGELEITGVSTYIHPLPNNHLLTVGLNGDDTGLDGQIQLQIFDVDDLSTPQRVHSWVPQFDAPGLVWSTALYDHLAFNYFDQSNVLTIPLTYWADELDQHFSGFAAFRVDVETGFQELGRLDHSDLARADYCDGDALGTDVCSDGVYLEAAFPRRAVTGLYEGATYIYTLSDVGIKVSLDSDFSNPIAVLPLSYDNDYWWY